MSKGQATKGRGSLKQEEGSELVEFSIASSLLLLVMFGIVDCSRAMYCEHYTAQMARQATRFAAVRGASYLGTSCASASYNCAATATDVTNYVLGQTPLGFTASALTVTTTWPGTTVKGADCSVSNINNSPGCVVSVKVAYGFSFVLPFLPKAALALASTSKVAIVQ